MYLKKYPRISRLCDKNSPPSKRCITPDELKDLLDGEVIIEEKIDGGVMGIANDRIIGRNRVIGIKENTKRFAGLNGWRGAKAYEISQIPDGWMVFGEWMYTKHNIHYTRLLDWFVAFDVWDGREFLGENKYKAITDLGFYWVGVVDIRDDLTPDTVMEYVRMVSRGTSSIGDETMEGVVIKNPDKQLMGKYVRREFMDSMEEHWLKSGLVVNRLKSWSCR